MLLSAPMGYLAAAVPIAWLEVKLRTLKTQTLIALISVPVMSAAIWLPSLDVNEPV